MQKHISILISPIIVAILSSCALSAESSPTGNEAETLAKITVAAGDFTRIDTPISIDLNSITLDIPAEEIHLFEIKDSQRIEIPVQLETGTPQRLWWILSGTTPSGQSRTFELCKADSAPQSQLTDIVKAAKGEKFLDIQVGDDKVMRYHHAIVPVPEDMGKVPEERRPLYDRSGFIHPLWSPAGNVLTDIHPPDHLHHMGLWMPWTHTQFEGKRVDFWNVGDGTGTVRFAKYLSTTSGPVYGGFQAEQEHIARKTSKGEQVILNEVWDICVYNVRGEPGKEYWLIDFKSTQRCVADSPLIQEKYRYGGLGFRGAREWKDENAAYLTSEGKTCVDANGTRARWCDTAGAVEGKWEGVTHFSHPQNFQHPEPMRVWPPENHYVFFNFCPSQAGQWEMKPGEDHVFRYRLYVHEGKINVEDAERIWHDYANPPVVTVEPN
jgi:hypothetical protein